MSDVKRWWMWQEWDSAEMREAGKGTKRAVQWGHDIKPEYYVLASDYDACVQKLSAKCEELETHGRALDQCRALLKQECDDVIPLRTRCAALRAELARTKELLCEFLTEADQVAWFDESEDKQFARALSWVKSHHALRAEVERLAEELQRTNGTASLAIQHRDAAEREVERLTREVDTLKRERVTLEAWVQDHHEIEGNLHAALTDLEMAVSDLMREEDFEVSETLSTALDIARAALAADVDDCPHGPGCGHSPPDQPAACEHEWRLSSRSAPNPPMVCRKCGSVQTAEGK